jgi:glycosyltransferase involved in cell wall biosynthesis
MNNGKKDILILMGRYLPGYKDGGPVRSIKNLTDFLGEEYNFMVLTCDRDHGDTKPYPNIKANDWNQVGKTKVYYVPPKGFTFKTIYKLSKYADLLYICGCFNDYAINALILKRFGIIKKPVVIAAMGLFSPKEFHLKYKKKKAFTTFFNLAGMFKDIYWSVTSEMELRELRQQIKVDNNFFIAQDLPRKVNTKPIVKNKESGKLKVVFISRIAPKKNLIGVIQILKQVKSDIEFTIYGSKHIPEYWKECEKELKNLPSNIKWHYGGIIDSEQVVEVLKEQHVLLFPTLGENYGHVIQEALSAGCPSIISDQTPWGDLEKNGAGFVYPVDNKQSFINAVESYANLNKEQFYNCSNKALAYAFNNSNNKVEKTGYRKIFELKG